MDNKGQGNQTETLETEFDIDSNTKKDTARIYEYSFYVMYKFIKENKEKSKKIVSGRGTEGRSLIGLKDDTTKEYDYIVWLSSKGLTTQLARLVMRLLTVYNVDYVPFEHIGDCGVALPFYRNENGRKTGYILFDNFADFFNFPRKNLPTLLEYKEIDCVKAVILSENIDSVLEEGYHRLLEMNNDCDPITYSTIKDFFLLFPDNEFSIFKSYIEKFNRDVKKLIGHQTIIMPSEDVVDNLKEDMRAAFRSFEFDKKLKEDGVYEKHIKRIENNFWGRELYKAAFGSSPFAESLISAEWYFQTHVDYSVLEQSAIITGYLKSVEQLLFALIRLSIDTGRQIKKTRSSEVIEYSSENEKRVDTSIGSINKYLKREANKDLWDTGDFVIRYAIRKLENYRKEYRNGYFHKDNIFSSKEIEEIRYNTFFIHYLLVGCMKVEETEKEKIGIIEEDKTPNEDQVFSYKKIEEWLDRILGWDVLLPTTGMVLFNIHRRSQDAWQISFQTFDGFSEKGFPENIKYPCMIDELNWLETKDMEETVKSTIAFLKTYLERGKYAEKLKSFTKVTAYAFGQCTTLGEATE